MNINNENIFKVIKRNENYEELLIYCDIKCDYHNSKNVFHLPMKRVVGL